MHKARRQALWKECIFTLNQNEKETKKLSMNGQKRNSLKLLSKKSLFSEILWQNFPRFFPERDERNADTVCFF